MVTPLAHVSGEMRGLVQSCLRCGEVLTDYRNALVSDARPLKGWEAGAVVVVAGGTSVLADHIDPLQYAAAPCAPREALQ